MEHQIPIDISREIPVVRERPVMSTGLENSKSRLVFARWDKDFQAGDYGAGENLRREFIAGADGLEEKSLEKLRDHLENPNKYAVLAFIDRLNLDIDREAVVARLAHTQAILYEEGSAFHGFRQNINQDHVAGSYFPIYRLASVQLDSKEAIDEYQARTLRHELFHAASSQVSITRGNSLDGFDILQTVTGLSRNAHQYTPAADTGENVYSEIHMSYAWLNEGVTELLTDMLEKELFGDGEAQSLPYEYEVKLVRLISEVGIVPLKSFFEAYFEEPDLDAPPGQRMPKWHKLQQELKQAFGPRFLQRLESEIKSEEFGTYELTRNDGARLKAMKFEWEHRDHAQNYHHKRGRIKRSQRQRIGISI